MRNNASNYLKQNYKSKVKELASLALDAVVQRKAVESLKEVMSEQEHKGIINQHDIDTILKQINGNLNEEEFWDIYHKNFDMIHKNFFRNLRKQYPSLTASDLRFCALLRLNLSTKDNCAVHQSHYSWGRNSPLPNKKETCHSRKY